jgi:hypothetical protein
MCETQSLLASREASYSAERETTQAILIAVVLTPLPRKGIA